MINMTRAGEVGGFLDAVLLQVAENFEAEVKLRGKIKSAMTYPVVVFVMAILAVIGMLLFIVPIFAKMFPDMGAQLPAPDPGAGVPVDGAQGRRRADPDRPDRPRASAGAGSSTSSGSARSSTR